MRAQTVMSSGDALTMGSTLSSELSHAHPCRTQGSRIVCTMQTQLPRSKRHIKHQGCLSKRETKPFYYIMQLHCTFSSFRNASPWLYKY